MFKIPFGAMPGSWGLKGKTREVAKIEYELSGFDKEYALAKIELSEEELRIKKVELLLEHGHISQRQHDFELAELRDDPITTLKVKYKYDKITDNEYEKELATLEGRGWVACIDMGYKTSNPNGGHFTLDWNDAFIEELHAAGHVAATPEDTVDLWFTDVCKNVALEELSGTGVFDDDADQSMEIKRKRLGGGRVEIR